MDEIAIRAKSGIPQHTLTQFATIDALLSGNYDGGMSCRELLRNGDLGIGTFDKLDGEMILLDAKVYQVKADGSVCVPELDITTPFATVVRFRGEKGIPIPKGTDMHVLEKILNKVIPNMNAFCAVKVKARFARIKARSVPAQSKPYQSLAEVTRNQAVFEYETITGTLVGFRCPSFVRGVNVPGYHLHFLSEDNSMGGHLLECMIEEGKAEVETYDGFLMILPEDESDFSNINFSIDRSQDLEKVERDIVIQH